MKNYTRGSVLTGIGFVVLVILVLLYIHSQSQPQASNKKVAVQTAPVATTTDTFQEQIACTNVRPQVEAEVAAFNASQKPTYSCAATDPCGIYVSQEDLGNLFYSPALNTCVDVVFSQTTLEASTGPKVWYQEYDFNDALTGNLKDWVQLIQHGSPYYTYADFTKKLTEYEPSSTPAPTTPGQP